MILIWDAESATSASKTPMQILASTSTLLKKVADAMSTPFHQQGAHPRAPALVKGSGPAALAAVTSAHVAWL